MHTLPPTCTARTPLQAFGAAAVSSKAATDPAAAFGYAIRYDASDVAGASKLCPHVAQAPPRMRDGTATVVKHDGRGSICNANSGGILTFVAALPAHGPASASRGSQEAHVYLICASSSMHTSAQSCCAAQRLRHSARSARTKMLGRRTRGGY